MEFRDFSLKLNARVRRFLLAIPAVLGLFRVLWRLAQIGQLILELFDLRHHFQFDLLQTFVQLYLELVDPGGAKFDVEFGHEVLGEIQYPVEVSGRQV